mgnify:CR=1 FL=1
MSYDTGKVDLFNRIPACHQKDHADCVRLKDIENLISMYKGVKVIGSIENLHYILPQNKLDEIAVTLALEDYNRLERIVDLCTYLRLYPFLRKYCRIFRISQGIFCCTIFSICTRQNGQPAESTKLQALSH